MILWGHDPDADEYLDGNPFNPNAKDWTTDCMDSEQKGNCEGCGAPRKAANCEYCGRLG